MLASWLVGQVDEDNNEKNVEVDRLKVAFKRIVIMEGDKNPERVRSMNTIIKM